METRVAPNAAQRGWDRTRAVVVAARISLAQIKHHKLLNLNLGRTSSAVKPCLWMTGATADNEDDRAIKKIPEKHRGLQIMDEIYFAAEASELSSGPDEDLENDAEQEEADYEANLAELLEHVQDSADVDDTSAEDDITNYEPRVTVSKEFSREAIDCLVTRGTFAFLSRYLLHAEEYSSSNYTVSELLAALGFRLPLGIVRDPKYTDRQFEIALQVAIRYALSHRQRLPHPRTLDEVADHIRAANKIMVITGAGISTSLGIPDFRSDDGLYSQLEHLGLADPQEVFEINTFKEDPSIFYSVAVKILPEQNLHEGTPTHKFIKLLHDKNKLLRNYTQNIDNLEQYVGIPKERIVQCHGSFGSAHCITCGFAVEKGEDLFPAIKDGVIPRCSQCKNRKAQGKRKKSSRGLHGSDSEDDGGNEASYGVLKPDITFFGESLPPRFDQMLFDEGDAHNCDLIICIGTSLRVSPVSEIVKVASRQIPQIFISKVPAKHLTFEVSFLGGCDDVVELLCQKLGWDLNHSMSVRPKDLPVDQYPGGSIQNVDGVFTFTPEITKTEIKTDFEETEGFEHTPLHNDVKAEIPGNSPVAQTNIHSAEIPIKTEFPLAEPSPKKSPYLK